MNPPSPEECPVAFKEWWGVCRAIADGRQSIILRKGGISEGLRGFVPDEPAFWLYPTWTHEQEQGLKWPSPPLDVRPGFVPIDVFVTVADVRRIEQIEELEPLADQHAWTEETIRKRFFYRSPGIWLLSIQAQRLPEPRWIAVEPHHEGCKTWVRLGTPVGGAR